MAQIFEDDKPQTIVVTPAQLKQEEHGALLCYPGTELESFSSRIDQLERLGVEELILEGESKVGKYGIIGRGCVSTVVKARLKTENEIIALKIRRADANRSDMKRDFELQRLANSFGVGPRAIAVSNDLFAMEYVDSVKLGKWFQTLKTRTSKRYTRGLIRDSLQQCYLLDTHGLDHGELSNPLKHILIRKDNKEEKKKVEDVGPRTAIIDFESASTKRKVANLTSVAQFFFLGGWQAEKIHKILWPSSSESDFPAKREELIRILRDYKASPNRELFEEFLSFTGCGQTKH